MVPYPFDGTSSAHTTFAGGRRSKAPSPSQPVDVADPSRPRESKRCASLTMISSYHSPSLFVSGTCRLATRHANHLLPGSPTEGGLRGWQLRRLKPLPPPMPRNPSNGVGRSRRGSCQMVLTAYSKSHNFVRRPFCSSDPASCDKKIFLGIMNSTTGGFLICFVNSASSN